MAIRHTSQPILSHDAATTTFAKNINWILRTAIGKSGTSGEAARAAFQEVDKLGLRVGKESNAVLPHVVEVVVAAVVVVVAAELIEVVLVVVVVVVVVVIVVVVLVVIVLVVLVVIISGVVVIAIVMHMTYTWQTNAFARHMTNKWHTHERQMTNTWHTHDRFEA